LKTIEVSPQAAQPTPEPAPRSGTLALLVREGKKASNLRDWGFEVVAVEDDAEALQLIPRLSPDVVLVGMGSSEASRTRAHGLVRAIRSARGPATPVVLVPRRRGTDDEELAFQAGATDVWPEDLGPVAWKKRLRFVVDAARAFDQLSRSSQKLERAKRLARIATWEWDLGSNRVCWSEELRSLLSRSEPGEPAGIDAMLEMVHPSDRDRVAQKISESIRERRAFRFDHRAVRFDGTELVVHQEGDVVSNESGEPVLVDAVVVDVTEIKKAELQIHSLANYDALTGLPNRLSFLDLLENACFRDERSGGAVAVALLDIDRFKEVNESLGHRAGDALLKEVAERVLSSVRKGDCVAREGNSFLRTVARHGGDEFLVMLSDVEEAHDAARAARRILESLRRPFQIDGREVFVTGSIGIAFASGGATPTGELLRQAEIAMYSAKGQGRDTFQFFDDSMNRAVVERFEIESRLRHSLELGELALFYQPLVSARTRKLVGVEALLRWHHPVKGLLTADSFVPLAEETGLIVPIGRWVLRTACEQLRLWHKEGLGPMRLAVNLSPRELRAPGFVATLAKILEETETRPDQLELELTERGVMGNDRRTVEVLLRLKEIGVRLAVDDFGTGNTTFQYLKNFPLTTIKIDKSFTQGIANDARDAAITKALLAMAQRLELNVVAEGVEDEAQLSFLGAHECNEVQGYLFGKPIPASSLTALLKEQSIR
jgi:diguanylate cyclase (GGDEF)-like protein